MLRKKQYGYLSRRDMSAESSLGYTSRNFTKEKFHSTKGFSCSELSQIDPYVTIIAQKKKPQTHQQMFETNKLFSLTILNQSKEHQ